MIITHPGARTRALYKWESEDLLNRKTAADEITLGRAEQVMCWLWWRFDCRRKRPIIYYSWVPGLSDCQGYTQITLRDGDHNRLIVTHEVVHAMGYGSSSNPHNAGFVKTYIRAMNIVFGWDEDELTCQALIRRLL